MFRTVLALCSIAVANAVDPTRVLFIGNSFTYVNDLPHQFLHIASSLGKTVEVANSTIGGCTLFAQQPQFDDRTKQLLTEEWDFIVLQDYSALPTVEKARREYLQPAVKTFIENRKKAEIVMYLTWGYHDGNTGPCPSSDTAKCFPDGTLANLTDPPCESNPSWHNTVDTFACMGFSLVRGYLDMFNYGVNRVAPCGVSWQVVRGVTTIPDNCTTAINSQYPYPLNVTLPFPTTGSLKDLMLYRILAGGVIDKHPNVAGQYLNALTFFATLFGESPVGAASPLPTEKGDTPLTPEQLQQMQQIVNEVVLGHKNVWRIP
eukprot:TRINITY_DN21838_c0_g1_i1.p1 TRINITY_DN21838_c0_g1~~TRINITY_DN21838_c0_g1_i1.p1  ORF type:complete len:318 (+),score=52.54 TRINITY_DN21838_c0_g1_i1:331-1284(+)